jgi:glucose-1-phosphate adenylyltransferase
MNPKEVLTLILAGGKGTRLEPLTRDRAKPAVPFGGAYRIIDFTLSNCINSGLRRVLVLTQYKAASLDRHLHIGWQFLHRELDEFIEVLPPQQRLDDHWYQGTADAVYQNIYSIEKHQARYILILSGDHIYKMDYADLLRRHIEAGAVATLACIPVPLAESDQFGVIQVDNSWRIRGFVEKPATTDPMPDDPNKFLANMGVYVFNARFLFDELCRDATDNRSSHDFGKNIIPAIIDRHPVYAYPFRDRNTGRTPYWRDVGTIDAYYEANKDLVAVEPELNLYDQSWVIHTYHPPYPPPKTVFTQMNGASRRVGEVLGSIICPGSIVSGGRAMHSVLSWNVRVNSWADVQDSILFEGVDVGRRARIRRAIIDKGVHVPPEMELGYDLEADRKRGLTVTDTGVVVVGKEARLA